MDEPTNHLDIDAKELLEKALQDYDGTLLFVSHDRYFINQLANKIVVFDNGHAKVYNGNYSYYLDEKAKQEANVVETENQQIVKKLVNKNYLIKSKNNEIHKRENYNVLLILLKNKLIN